MENVSSNKQVNFAITGNNVEKDMQISVALFIIIHEQMIDLRGLDLDFGLIGG